MEAKCPHSSTHLPEDLTQEDLSQEISNSHQSPSQSSAAPSSTGNGGSAQSMTATTASLDPIVYQAALDYQYNRVPFPDHQQDLSQMGSWDTPIEPFVHTLVIGNDFILSPNYPSGTAVNATDGFLGSVAEVGDTKEEAVELLRANLRRKL
ncbi:uncharacterized protein BHQ10_008634 [Talaromyces amestolkiae]|uniref:Uncharacterized protein n=1 Tax=Talaromyces amestolkiae TaxID=1196081 RepID=A0A364L9Y0_TALAM|nr:uncharacterized protein BHQ10_008634 [Talaromyces amestolkiae]RAO72622.1 hypothetical protein BHQ10_008634 [Talaromyces amestolkiae]